MKPRSRLFAAVPLFAVLSSGAAAQPQQVHEAGGKLGRDAAKGGDTDVLVCFRSIRPNSIT